MTINEAFNILLQAWHGNKDTHDYPSFDDINEALDVLEQALEYLEQLETFITWLRGQTFRKTDEVDKIFTKLKEVLDNE